MNRSQSVCNKYKIAASRTNKAMDHDALSGLISVSAETIALLIEAGLVDLGMDFHRLPRRDLQSLCKKNNIRANMTNQAMAIALNSLKSRPNSRYDSKDLISTKDLQVKRKAKGTKSAQKKKLRKKQVVSPFVALMKIKEEIESPDWMEGANISSDVMFSILSHLPTEVILRLKTICRDWANIISDPVFIRAHCSRPCPITSFFTNVTNMSLPAPGKPYHFFKPMQLSPKFPRMITLFLSSGFKAASNSHGLVCFHRDIDGAIVLANPATSYWAIIPRPPLDTSSQKPSNEYYSPPLIIFDPQKSAHFKITIATCIRMISLRFHIYSSETSSWTQSSFSPRDENMYWGGIFRDIYACKASRMGGGSVCYHGGNHHTMCGYEIATDTYWVTHLPWSQYITMEENCYFLARDGEIYSVVINRKSKTVKVQRLDENKCWVLEGESKSEELVMFRPSIKFPHLSYDAVRKALIFTVTQQGLYAFHFSSSRIEALGEDYDDFGQEKLPHANTLASFHGGKRDTHALEQLLRNATIGDK